jgi:hypothetical protein
MTHLEKAAAKEWQGSRERVEKLLGGPHRAAAHELMAFLATMTLADAPALLARVKRGPWRSADADTRFEFLSIVDTPMVGLRERHELPPFDDPLFEAAPIAFLTLREWLR